MLQEILIFAFIVLITVLNFIFVHGVIKQISKISDSFIDSLKEVQYEYFKRVNELQKLLKSNIPEAEKAEKSENTIEKGETEEIPLDETVRVPIVDGVKIKFEDEEESFPININ